MCIRDRQGIAEQGLRLYFLSSPFAAYNLLLATLFPSVERALPAAVERDVTLLVETAGAFSDTAKLRDFLMRFSDDHLAALWDLHHPYFYGGEDPETTIRNLGAYVRHVHVKDSAPAPDGRAYCLVGEGELPLGDMIVALSSVNYDGYLSLEWNPAWMPELDDMEICLLYTSDAADEL